MDNRSAGATAAYLINQWLGELPGRTSHILVALSRSVFRGEEQREAHGALDGPIVTTPAAIQVITPFNVPLETG